MTNLRDKDVVRRCIFKPYHKGLGPIFLLVVWDTHEFEKPNHWRLGYQLSMKAGKRTVIFEGEDFGCPRGQSIDSDETMEGIMGFLTLRPGDTDSEFFESYTPEQLDYCSQHAEALSCEVERRFGREE